MESEDTEVGLYGKMRQGETMERQDYPVRVLRKGDKEDDPYLKGTTAQERLLMMWPLALQAWAFKGEDHRESRLSRHVVRVLRRGR